MTADHPVRPWYVCNGNPCTCTKPGRAPDLSPAEAARVAEFDAAPPDGVRTGPGGCHAALIVRGEHYWCDSKAPHGGWPHGSTAAETIWRGSGPAEDPADTDGLPS